MTEMEFADRLRNYRKSKNMTQQELAERLGVSDKSVSRWENGSFPDVALLGPLAKELGVTVDDLLGTTPPIRTLQRSDLQNWLSFAFAIGGGVAFYLLAIFLPRYLCYAAYLGAMAYGVYLQKNYTFHSKWFHAGNLVMNFFVNLQFFSGLLQTLIVLYTMGGSLNIINALINEGTNYARTMSPLGYGLIFALRPLMALALTGFTGWAIRQWWNGKAQPVHPSFTPKNLAVTKVLPVVFPLLLAGYWLLYAGETSILPIWFYQHQGTPFMILWLASAALTALLLIRGRHPWMLLPAGMMQLSTLMLPQLCTVLRSIGLSTGNLHTGYGTFNPKLYRSFLEPADERFVVFALIVAALYLLCCFVKFWDSPPKAENPGENPGM